MRSRLNCCSFRILVPLKLTGGGFRTVLDSDRLCAGCVVAFGVDGSSAVAWLQLSGRAREIQHLSGWRLADPCWQWPPPVSRGSLPGSKKCRGPARNTLPEIGISTYFVVLHVSVTGGSSSPRDILSDFCEIIDDWLVDLQNLVSLQSPQRFFSCLNVIYFSKSVVCCKFRVSVPKMGQ